MPNAAVLLADGFEEIEATTIIDVLRRGGVDTRILGLGAGRVRGAHDVVVEVDQLLGDASADPWDMVVLPGGMPGAATLRDDSRVLALVRRQVEGGRRVAAICAAPIVLAAAGVLDGRQATCYPGFEDDLGGAVLSTSRVVVDGKVTTSRGPGTALWFALQLVAQLRGDEVAEDLARGMLVG